MLLAGIHLTVAGTLIVWQEALKWPYLKAEMASSRSASLLLTAWDGEEETVTFSPCGMWGPIPLQELIVGMGELPAATLSGWLEDCPASWTVAGVLHAGCGSNTKQTEMRVAISLCALVPLQWFLFGSFPLIRPKRWWPEPGAFITLCTVAAFILVLIPGIGVLSRLPALFAGLAWFWWLGLLVWKTLRSGWRLAARAMAHGH